MHQHDEAHVTALASRVLGNAEKAAEWLARPALQLGGRAPRDLLASAEGARRVEELLRQIDDDNRLHGASTRRA
jgi:putative toxin-antitoxin system antitoxin component (TIGR02293 family)